MYVNSSFFSITKYKRLLKLEMSIYLLFTESKTDLKTLEDNIRQAEDQMRGLDQVRCPKTEKMRLNCEEKTITSRKNVGSPLLIITLNITAVHYQYCQVDFFIFFFLVIFHDSAIWYNYLSLYKN